MGSSRLYADLVEFENHPHEDLRPAREPSETSPGRWSSRESLKALPSLKAFNSKFTSY